MTTTLKADLFVPEVATAVATAEFPNRLAVSFAGAPFVRPFPPEAILGEEGDTVKFPRYAPLGEFAAMTEDQALVPEALATAQDTATVQVAGKAVEVTDYASLAARGNPSEEVGRQIARLAARYIDSRLVVEASTTSLTATLAGTITYNAFIALILDKWGDSAFEMAGGLVVHPKQLGDLFQLKEFKSADYKNVAEAIAAMRGGRNPGEPVGVLAGFPVYVSGRIKVNVATPNTYEALILKSGSIGLKFQRTLLVEKDRDILKKNDVIAADVRFAPHLFYGDPLPAIKWTTQ